MLPIVLPKKFRDCETCPEMVVVPPGTFIMGSPETEKGRDSDEGQHTVVIAYSFAVSKGPITWHLWEACVREGKCDGPSVEAALRLDRDGKPIPNYGGHVRGNHPVVGVSWWDAQRSSTGSTVRLAKRHIAFCRNQNSNTRPVQALPRFIGGATSQATTMRIMESILGRIWEGWLKGAIYG
jgi:hypothetical protein